MGVVKVEMLIADLFEAAGVTRTWGEGLAAQAGQTQARWQTLWVAASGSFTVPQVARRLGVSRQNVQRIVGDLVDADLLHYTDNPDHKTSPIVALTPAGTQVLYRLNEAADDANSRLLELLTESDLDTLSALLARLVASVKTVSTDGPRPIDAPLPEEART